MAGDPALTDVLTADLERLYAAATRRLEALVRAGLARGLDPSRIGTGGQRAGDATLAYRQRQHEQAMAVLERLRTEGGIIAARTIEISYGSGLVAVDRVLGETITAAGRFGRIHTGAVEALAANLTASLDAAASAVGDRIGDVFERAQALEGALREDRPILKGARFIGRRHNDPWRKAALEVIGDATIGLDTRRQASALLSRRLVTEGLSDGLTGLVDSSGRRWALDTYTEMVARTTTAEAVTAGTANRLTEGGLDLVTITAHPHAADVCTPYDGRTFSLSGKDDRYPPLTLTPPFHPRCRHRLGPASANLDAFERELEAAVRENIEPTRAAGPVQLPDGRLGKLLDDVDNLTRPDRLNVNALRSAERSDLVAQDTLAGGQVAYRLTEQGEAALATRRRYDAALRAGAGDERARLEAGALPRQAPDSRSAVGSPWGRHYEPVHTADTVDNFADQELGRMIDADPGPEPGRDEAIVRELKLEERRTNKALRQAFGEDLYKFVNSAAGQRAELRRRYLDGDVGLDDLEDAFAEDYRDREERRLKREAKQLDDAYIKRPIPCFSCGHLKRKPADICRVCGDDPVPLGTSESDFNRAYGYAPSSDREGTPAGFRPWG